MLAGCSNDEAMEENSVHARDRTAIEASEKTPVWPQFLPIETIKTGLTEVALGVTMFTALVTSVASFEFLPPPKVGWWINW